jgi:3-hydroxyacyl-CoA dehydrogenase
LDAKEQAMPVIRSAAVLGAGVMGSSIAAHLANAGIPSLLLDLVPADLTETEKQRGLSLDHREVRSRVAREAIRKTLQAKPAAFGAAERARLVTPGNFEDDLPKLSGVDWVVEAVVERFEVKAALFQKLSPHLDSSALLTTNTSGLSVRALAEVLPPELRPRFFGTHFFNPPRYMHLLELVPGGATEPGLLEAFAQFAERRLGKGVVRAKDTPNFIANRIGVFSFFSTVRAMERHGLAPEEVDVLTGAAMARPKTGTFGTADLVGLDVLAHAARTQFEDAPADERRDVFRLPPWMERMLAGGLLGRKSGAGFYRRAGEGGSKALLVLDAQSMEYRPARRPALPLLAELVSIDAPDERVRRLVSSRDAAGRFAWDVLAETLLYAAHRLPEVADDVATVDEAMRWGFAWAFGPFELWDALGVRASVKRMAAEAREVPEPVRLLAESRAPSFYRKSSAGTRIWDFSRKAHVVLREDPRALLLSDLKRAGKILFRNDEASLVDLGDRVACLEFHSKMNVIGAGIVAAIRRAQAEAGIGFDALVIGNRGEHFSAGADLQLLLTQAQQGNLAEIEAMVEAFQGAMMSLKYSPVPVVAAPFGRVLGGGAEICLHAHRLQASHETYLGLVEVGVGLVPAGGGCKEMLLRAMEACAGVSGADPFPFVGRVFETVGQAKVSLSAWEARELGYLREGDGVTMNPDHLLHEAKRAALGLLETGWQPLHRPAAVSVTGRDGLGNFRSMLHNLKLARRVSEHDALVGEKLAGILCGGEVDAGTVVDEEYLLGLERRAFLELCGCPKTLERMLHTLKTGKPLRN